MYENTVVLVTGGTGSWGHELVKQLLEKNPKEIRVFSRGELAQVKMEREFQDKRIKFIIGDVRDKDALRRATYGVDYVFHLAALKHVPVCEYQPQEAVKTNVEGTINLINACIENKIKKVIDVSTDKAVAPLNLYGMTKAVGERLIIQANNLEGNTKFVCIRAGNVLGTNGSVVPLFLEQIKKYNKITITDMEMRRYFLTVQKAIGLLFKAAERSFGGETFVMKMPTCKIIDLAEVLIEKCGNLETTIEMVGIRPGEKLYEELISQYEMTSTYEYDEAYYLIAPSIHIEGLKDHYNNFQAIRKVGVNEEIMKNMLMDKTQIKEILKEGEFITF